MIYYIHDTLHLRSKYMAGYWPLDVCGFSMCAHDIIDI